MGVSEDRLSALPEELLLVIKSLLPFKDALTTTFLSKRWRFIPLDLKNLEFKESDFVITKPGNVAALEAQREAFVDFVLSWIDRRRRVNTSGRPRKLLLAFSRPEEHLAKVQRILGRLINRKLDEVDIDFSDPNWDEEDFKNCRPETFVQLPRIWDCAFRNVQLLKLSSCNIPEISSCFDDDFTRLKSVSLEWITIEKGTALNDFLEICPFLENLAMRRCTLEEFVEIESESLKSLIMEKCCSVDDETSPVVAIDTPELTVFKYHSGVLVIFQFKSRMSLDLEASLDFGLQKQYDAAENYAFNLQASLHEFIDVKTLTVSTYVLQVISHGDDEEPVLLGNALSSLKHLILKASLIEEEVYGITFFLRACPNLEVLTIDLNLNTPNIFFPDDDPPYDYEKHPFVMKNSAEYDVMEEHPCVQWKLKRVVVEGFRGRANELHALEYFLKYGRVLESIQINISDEMAADGRCDYMEKAESLLKSEKGSRDVQILISTHPAVAV